MAHDFFIPEHVLMAMMDDSQDPRFARHGGIVKHRREKSSHQGISELKDVTFLYAEWVNDDYFAEICNMQSLEYLNLQTVTVEDLSPLAGLSNLKALQLDSIRKAGDFAFLKSMTHLRGLYLTNVKHMPDMEFFSDMHHVRRLGIEGSINTKVKISSLAPLAGLWSLEELYMASVTLSDKDLTPLARCPNLKVLQCARFAPKKSFEELRAAMPDLECHWCDQWKIG